MTLIDGFPQLPGPQVRFLSHGFRTIERPAGNKLEHSNAQPRRPSVVVSESRVPPWWGGCDSVVVVPGARSWTSAANSLNHVNPLLFYPLSRTLIPCISRVVFWLNPSLGRCKICCRYLLGFKCSPPRSRVKRMRSAKLRHWPRGFDSIRRSEVLVKYAILRAFIT